MMCNEHGYVMAIEKLLDLDIPERARYIRVMFDEITRILNHLMWIGTHALDVGAMTMFLYAFREREDLMDLYEAVSGTRMHATYYRPGGVARDLPDAMPQYQQNRWRSKREAARLNDNRQGSLLDFTEDFTQRFPGYVDEYETLLTDNRIWKQRTVDIGIVSEERAIFQSPSRSRAHYTSSTHNRGDPCSRWFDCRAWIRPAFRCRDAIIRYAGPRALSLLHRAPAPGAKRHARRDVEGQS